VILVLVGVTLVTFAMLFITGDPAALLAGEDASRADVERIRQEMGFDRPWPVQYVDYVGRAVRGDFGVSYRQRQPVFGLILERLPATAQLAFAALLLATVVAIPTGVIAATRRGSLADYVAQFVAMTGQAIPPFWLALMLMLVFAVNLRWVPVSGYQDWTHVILPAVSLAFAPMALQMRLVRSSVLEVLRRDYVRTARAKGQRASVVIVKHALRNALIPVVTVVGLQLGGLMAGTVVIESIFAWPGLGRLMLNAIYAKDIPIVMAGLIIIAVIYVFINLLVDLVYVVLDPRIRY
jgi:peptide/nickel transport system permease protein